MADSAASGARRNWLRVGLGAGVLALLLGLAVALEWGLDPDRQSRELALRDARAWAEMDAGQVWDDSSACFQSRHPRGDFIAEQLRPDPLFPHLRAPADTRYTVVAVRLEGPYRRVEVRVEPPGYPQSDYEIDIREYGARWAVVDRGALGHRIQDECALEGRT